MLYRLITNSGTFRRLEPVPFKDFSSFGNQEKDLEDLIARNILDMLFEGASPMPIFQVQFDDRCFIGLRVSKLDVQGIRFDEVPDVNYFKFSSKKELCNDSPSG